MLVAMLRLMGKAYWLNEAAATLYRLHNHKLCGLNITMAPVDATLAVMFQERIGY